MSLFSIPPLPALCRGLFPVALAVLLQSTLVLLLALIAGRIASRRGPVFQSAVYRAALVGVLVAALLPFCPVRPPRPAWSLPLPVSVLAPIQVSPPPAVDDR